MPRTENRSSEQAGAETVIVVDDEASVRRSLGRLLNSLGLASREFASGSDLLAGENFEGACCFLVDIHMPGMKGYEVAERLQEVAPGVPIILMTAHLEEQVRWREWSAPTAALLLKPFSDEDLILTLRRVAAARI